MAFKLIALMVATVCIIMQVQADPSKDSGEKVAIFVKDSKNGELRFLGAQGVDQWITNKQNWLEQLRPVTGVDNGGVLPGGVLPGGDLIITGTGGGTIPTVGVQDGVLYDDAGDNKPIIINLSSLNGGGNGGGGNGGVVGNGNGALDAAISASPIENLLPQIVAQAALQQRRRVPNRRRVPSRRRRPNKGYKKYYIVRAQA